MKMGQGNDVIVWNAGGLLMVRPLTGEAQTWLHENVQDDAQWFGESLAVEHRYAEPLITGLRDAGFTVR